MRFPIRYLSLGILVSGLFGCILDPGEERRSEVLPGKYQADNDVAVAIYDFHSDGTFEFKRFEGTKLTITEEGKWRYRYIDPDTRYLDEIEVTRKDLVSDDTWQTQENVNYSYAIFASSENEFVLNPGSGDGHGFFGLLMLFADTNVHFHRQ